MLRCPSCGTVDLKARVSKLPRFRCDRGHEFDTPREDEVSVTLYQAEYESSFVDAPGGVPVALMKAAALRPSDQLSIEEIDLSQIEAALLRSFPKTRETLIAFY